MGQNSPSITTHTEFEVCISSSFRGIAL